MSKHNIEEKKIESLEVFRKLAPIARNTIGINTAEPALMSAIIYLLDRIDTNLEKLVEQTAPKAVEVAKTEETPVATKEEAKAVDKKTTSK